LAFWAGFDIHGAYPRTGWKPSPMRQRSVAIASGRIPSP
jgi:hypothetical protein